MLKILGFIFIFLGCFLIFNTHEAITLEIGLQIVTGMALLALGGAIQKQDSYKH